MFLATQNIGDGGFLMDVDIASVAFLGVGMS
jgi:hypothetical protein